MELCRIDSVVNPFPRINDDQSQEGPRPLSPLDFLFEQCQIDVELKRPVRVLAGITVMTANAVEHVDTRHHGPRRRQPRPNHVSQFISGRDQQHVTGITEE